MASGKRHPEELRERAVVMVFELRAESGESRGTIARVGRNLGINPETLRNWVERAEIDGGQRPGTTTDDKKRIAGVSARRKRLRMTVPAGPGHERPSDLLERDFTVPAPNRRWVADITYVETAGGFVYSSFILDLFFRKIVGWQVSDLLRAELALDALEMAIWSRGGRMDGKLVHHSDLWVPKTYATRRYS